MKCSSNNFSHNVMEQRYQTDLAGAITLIFPGPNIKAKVCLIKIPYPKIFRKCYDSLKLNFQRKNIAH